MPTLFRVVIAISLVALFGDNGRVYAEVKSEEICKQEKTCIVILERIGRLEEAFRRTISVIAENHDSAIQLKSLLENDSLVKSIMSSEISSESYFIYSNHTSNNDEQQSAVDSEMRVKVSLQYNFTSAIDKVNLIDIFSCLIAEADWIK